MAQALVALAAVTFGLGAVVCTSGCGGAARAHDSSSKRAAGAAVVLPKIVLKGDPDSDSDTYPGEPDDEHELFGRPAHAGDARAVAALVRRYYAAASRGDGATACRLVYLPVAESLLEEYGPQLGLSAPTCASVVAALFRRMHKRLSAENAALRTVAVRVRLNRGAVRLGFGRAEPPRYMLVHRERGAWKMEMPFDREQPIFVE
jgi:hypothetical protein